MNQNAEKKDDKKDSGWWVLWAFLAFFAVFASVDAFFVYTAITSHTGVVVENAYEVGLNYNDIIEEAERQKQDGNSVSN